MAFEGFLEADKFRRGHKASEVAQLVYGFRDKRPNLRKIMDTLYPEGKDATVKIHGDLLAESRAKVRANKADKARKSD